MWTRMADAEMSVVMAKYGIHRSCEGTGLRRTNLFPRALASPFGVALDSVSFRDT